MVKVQKNVRTPIFTEVKHRPRFNIETEDYTEKMVKDKNGY